MLIEGRNAFGRNGDSTAIGLSIFHDMGDDSFPQVINHLIESGL